MDFPDIDLQSVLGVIETAALWTWNHVPSFNDVARLVQTLIKLAKAIVDRREQVPQTLTRTVTATAALSQEIHLPFIESTVKLFAPTVSLEPQC